MRKLRGSKRCPQFNAEALAGSLAAEGMSLHAIETLAGRRLVNHEVDFETNAWWQNRSFHNYADHALGQDFAAGLGELAALAAEQRTAFMCSEAVWWRCHRRIITDWLLAQGHQVQHVLGPGQVQPASLSAGAVVRQETVRYPKPAS